MIKERYLIKEEGSELSLTMSLFSGDKNDLLKKLGDILRK